MDAGKAARNPSGKSAAHHWQPLVARMSRFGDSNYMNLLKSTFYGALKIPLKWGF
jgi:hypothetical protein